MLMKGVLKTLSEHTAFETDSREALVDEIESEGTLSQAIFDSLEQFKNEAREIALQKQYRIDIQKNDMKMTPGGYSYIEEIKGRLEFLSFYLLASPQVRITEEQVG